MFANSFILYFYVSEETHNDIILSLAPYPNLDQPI